MPSYKTRVHSALGTTCFNSLLSLPILWCACSVSHSGADHLIYLSHVTAGKHYHYTHIMDRLSRDAGVLRAQNADEYRRLLPDREGLSVVHRRHAMPCRADNKGSLEPQWAGSEVPFPSARWDKRGLAISLPGGRLSPALISIWDPASWESPAKRPPGCSVWNVIHPHSPAALFPSTESLDVRVSLKAHGNVYLSSRCCAVHPTLMSFILHSICSGVLLGASWSLLASIAVETKSTWSNHLMT